jgi:hydrogenase maturation protease
MAELETSDPRDDILVIGVGNEFRGDDGAGAFIARLLKRENPKGTRIECQRGEAATLMESWQGASTVILLDAVGPGKTPGGIYRFDASNDPLPGRFFESSTHGFGVAAAVELARALGRLPQCIIIYGIGGKDFSEGRRLSREVRMAAREVLEKVKMDILGAGSPEESSRLPSSLCGL